MTWPHCFQMYMDSWIYNWKKKYKQQIRATLYLANTLDPCEVMSVDNIPTGRIVVKCDPDHSPTGVKSMHLIDH